MFENTSLFSILLFKKGRKELSLLKKQNRLALDLRDMFQQSEDILKEEESELVMDSVKTETQTEKGVHSGPENLKKSRQKNS